MGRYEGKTAVVTGGSTGIGFATARILAAEGATVIITARDAGAVAAATKELGAKAQGLVSDTSRFADIEALAAKVGTLGKLDFLFINAGIAQFVPTEQVTEAHFDETMDVNTKGAYFTVQKLLPFLQSGSSIVINTSILDQKGFPATTVYAASKAALRSLTRAFAAEFAPKGIRVNAVCPGPISTPIYEKLGMSKEIQTGFEGQMREMNPMKRFGAPEEVAKAALFLAFDATYTTGAELPVDGGVSQL